MEASCGTPPDHLPCNPGSGCWPVLLNRQGLGLEVPALTGMMTLSGARLQTSSQPPLQPQCCPQCQRNSLQGPLALRTRACMWSHPTLLATCCGKRDTSVPQFPHLTLLLTFADPISQAHYETQVRKLEMLYVWTRVTQVQPVLCVLLTAAFPGRQSRTAATGKA